MPKNFQLYQVVGVVTSRVAFRRRKKYQLEKKNSVIFLDKNRKKMWNSESKWERNKTTEPWCKEYEWDDVKKIRSGEGWSGW